MKKTLTAIALIAACTLPFATPAHADWKNPHNWQLRLRAIDVAPSEDSSGTIPGEADVDNAVVPELDITYFFTNNISAELILAARRGLEPGRIEPWRRMGAAADAAGAIPLHG
jgi:outer membrane protein W